LEDIALANYQSRTDGRMDSRETLYLRRLIDGEFIKMFFLALFKTKLCP